MCDTAIRRYAATIFSVVSLGLVAESGSAQTLDHADTSTDTVLAKGTSASPISGAVTETPEEKPGDLDWTRVRIADTFTGDAARAALLGASKRLAKASCESVLSEFHNEHDLPLTAKLQELGASLQAYMRLIVFLDGTGTPQCGRRGILAFTSRNSRVVYLCGRDFARAARRDPRETQITIIHELLHTLGLGENPPSPRSISFRVLQRCAG
jgi:hypothetical protein